MKNLSSFNFLKNITSCLFIILLTTFSSLSYDERIDNTSSTNVNQTSSSLREAWNSIQRSSKKLGDRISSNSVSSLQEIQEDLKRGLTYLETNSVHITTNNTERFKTAVKGALEASKNIYHETDRKLSRTASKEFKKLQKSLESIQAQLPTNIFSTNAPTFRK